MVLAMADEITRETLLNLVKEQGEIVRQLKAAQAEKTQVRTHFSHFFSPLFHTQKSRLRSVIVTDVPPFSFFVFVGSASCSITIL